jgi:sodium/hydrogen antiporter
VEIDVMLALVGALGLLVAAASSKLRRLPVTEPLLGLVAGIILGPVLLDVLSIPPLTVEHSTLHEAARILLAISVMAVAIRYPSSDVRKQWAPVLLLLLIVMPGMAAISSGLVWLIMGLPIATALLVGTAIAPTDPVLASSAITGDAAEQDLPARNRQILSLESGSNDGLALPLVLLAVALAGPLSFPHAAAEMTWQVVGAILAGALIGWVGGRSLRLGEKRGAAESGPVLFFTIVLALGILGIAGLMKLDGILAVFAGGLAFNLASSGADRTSEVPIDESINRFGVLPLFVLLGAALPWEQWSHLGWSGPILVVAVLALRRVPLILLLRRPLHLQMPDALYLGWFGPVGVSALFYLTLEAERIGVNETALAAGSLMVFASTVAFGLTAVLGRVLYRRAVQGR